MKKYLFYSESGMSIMEVIVALFILAIILYQVVSVDFQKPKKRIEGKEAVDISVREISNFLNHEPFCNGTFRNKKFLNTNLAQIKNKSISIDEIKTGIPNSLRLYGTYDDSGSRDDSQVDYSEINGKKLKSNIVLKNMELTGPINGGNSGYAKLILTYSNRDQQQTYTRSIPVFIHLNSSGTTHTIQSCSVSPTSCYGETFELPTQICNHVSQTNFEIPAGSHASGKKIRHMLPKDGNGCACMGSSYCYKGYWSHKSVCFKE